MSVPRRGVSRIEFAWKPAYLSWGCCEPPAANRDVWKKGGVFSPGSGGLRPRVHLLLSVLPSRRWPSKGASSPSPLNQSHVLERCAGVPPWGGGGGSSPDPQSPGPRTRTTWTHREFPRSHTRKPVRDQGGHLTRRWGLILAPLQKPQPSLAFWGRGTPLTNPPRGASPDSTSKLPWPGRGHLPSEGIPTFFSFLSIFLAFLFNPGRRSIIPNFGSL